jgi:hypothetical protein
MQKRSFLAIVVAVVATIGVVAAAQEPDIAAYLHSYRWTNADARFGGFSGLEIADDGVEFEAISDDGLWVKSRLIRGVVDGPIIGVEGFEPALLKGRRTPYLPPIWDDAEGLAVASSGERFVSFEGNHRVWRYDDPFDFAVEIPQHPDFSGMQNNSSLEVLAIDGAGVLYTLPERSGVATRPCAV